MQKLRCFLLFVFALFIGLNLNAQTKKSTADILYEDMLSSTAKIVVFDSVVTKKSDLLKHIIIGSESGYLSTYDDFWGTKGHEDSYVFVNEFGNKAFFSDKDKEGQYRLYQADYLDGKWTNIALITDFDEDFTDMSCPFLMPDGITLYFSATSEDNLGGYDLYVTTYDSESSSFNSPENVGLPYNSKSNDYFCVIDEFNSLGYLVTDRGLSGDSLCVYMFVPTLSHQTYLDQDLSQAQLKNLANLSSIKDTWFDLSEVSEAKNRLNKIITDKAKQEKEGFFFVVNDDIIYTKLEDFKIDANMSRFNQLLSLREDLKDSSQRLEDMRYKYYTGSSDVKKQLKSQITTLEDEVEKQTQYLNTLEKEIRNTENLFLQDQ